MRSAVGWDGKGNERIGYGRKEEEKRKKEEEEEGRRAIGSSVAFFFFGSLSRSGSAGTIQPSSSS